MDTSGLLYRAFFSLPTTLTAPDGTPTNAVYGTLRMLNRLVEDYHPDLAVLCFDEGRVTFRTEVYEEYKAQRPEPPDELRPQFQIMREAGEALGWPVFSKEGYEADDLIATLARQGEERGDRVYIVTSDRDLLQLLSPRVSLLITKKGISELEEITEEEFEAEWGFPPSRWVDYKALRGDPSDNIPGVRGVGEKTARRLIARFGTVENLYQHLDQVESARLRKALEEARDEVLVWKRLVTLDRQVEGVELPAEPVRDGFASPRFHQFALRLGMKSLAQPQSLF